MPQALTLKIWLESPLKKIFEHAISQKRLLLVITLTAPLQSPKPNRYCH